MSEGIFEGEPKSSSLLSDQSYSLISEPDESFSSENSEIRK